MQFPKLPRPSPMGIIQGLSVGMMIYLFTTLFAPVKATEKFDPRENAFTALGAIVTLLATAYKDGREEKELRERPPGK